MLSSISRSRVSNSGFCRAMETRSPFLYGHAALAAAWSAPHGIHLRLQESASSGWSAAGQHRAPGRSQSRGQARHGCRRGALRPTGPAAGARDPGIPLPTRRGEKSAAAMLREQRIVRSRVITFSESADGNTFFLNGQQWSPDRDDSVTQIGDVEEWTVRNVSGEHHVFHIHQTDFLVTESNGERIDIGKVMDTVNIPFARNGRPGEVKLIMPFLEDRIAGRFVYHCHILEHEDGGMMANINVQPRR